MPQKEMFDNISLIGFMGSGKTTIARLLTTKIDKLYCDRSYLHVDTDGQIEKQVGDSISNIFSKFGESYFRQLETEVLLANLNDSTYKIISTGGGIVTIKKNIVALKAHSVVIYLRATPEHIYNNLLNDTSRPLLEGKNKLLKITALLEKRESLYQHACSICIDVTSKQPATILQETLSSLQRFI